MTAPSASPEPSSAPASVAPGITATAAAGWANSPHRLVLALGFAHWFGSTFGDPNGVSTPSFALGARVFPHLEVRARYSVSVDAKPLPTGRSAHVGFASLEIVVSQSMRVGGHTLSAYLGPMLLLTHTDASTPGAGYGLLAGMEYLVATGLGGRHAVGAFINVRGVYYGLPSDNLDLFSHPRRDAQIDTGLLTTLF